jgi:protein-S-isoprenylcysteine O-methyltransferase Ste14
VQEAGLWERTIGRVPDGIFRLLGGVGFAAYAVWQAGRYAIYANKLVFVLETLTYALLSISYLTRRAPVERARGAGEVLLPLVGAVLPFALLLADPVRDGRERAIMWVLAAGSALSVAGYASLRRSFSITVEAREPVTRGPYRLVRHPVYAGQILAATGVVIWRFAWWSALLYLAFVAVQVTRAALEERKIAAVFPEYAEYRKRTWRFVPLVY